MYTEEQLQFINYKGDESIILSATAGSGKEQPLFCNVLTPYGWSEMGNLRVNDKVLAPNGDVANILNIYPQGKKDVFKFIMSDGTFTYAGKNHIWKIIHNEQEYIMDTQIIMEKLKENENLYIPLTNIERPEENLIVSPFKYGKLIAKTYMKLIPDIYLLSSRYQRIELLKGLLHKNENLTNNVLHVGTKGTEKNITGLINSIGGIAIPETENDKLNLILYLPDDLQDFIKTEKPERRIVSVEYFGITECQCIEIDHHSHLYITDNYIVTHNTHSCVGRLNRMIDDGVDPSRIIFFSFTNDAVDELKSRIKHDVKITTIHSFTSSLLAKMRKFKPIVTFYDFVNWYKEKYKPTMRDSIAVKKTYGDNLDLFYEEGTLISAAFSAYKLQAVSRIKGITKPKYYDYYTQFIKETKSRDFSDLLIDTESLSRNPEYKHFFEGLFDYVFVDEYQDTSTLQMKILLRMKAKQYHLIGDISQCLLHDSKILTTTGYKLIQDLKIGEKVITCAGSERIISKKIAKIDKKQYDGPIIKLTTKTGKVISTTPQHSHFVQLPKNKYVLIISYNKDFGYYLNILSKHEQSDKYWVVGIFDDLISANEAKDNIINKYGYNYFSFEDGIDIIRNIGLSMQQPFKTTKSDVNITLCFTYHDNKIYHALHSHNTNKPIQNFFREYNNALGNKYKSVISILDSKMSNLMKSINLISENIGLNILARFGKNTFIQQPADNIIEGMLITLYEKNNIIEDTIIKVEHLIENNFVYDIDVKHTHNLIVNDIITHNSIYGFSGANCNAIERLLNDNHETITMSLTKNFRSAKNIVENSNKYTNLIAIPHNQNNGVVHDKLITLPELLDMMEDGKPLTILARTNRVLKELEKDCFKRKIKMKYQNLITQQDITKIKEFKINGGLKKRLDSVSRYYSNTQGLIKFIEENKDSNVFATTIHKSKGREYPRCVIVNSIDPGIQGADDIDDIENYSFINEYGSIDMESKNIHYVAVTRPKEELYFLIYII